MAKFLMSINFFIYNEHILPVPKPFIKSGLHYIIKKFNNKFTNKQGINKEYKVGDWENHNWYL